MKTGTWTPTWQGASGQSGPSYSTREASYTKIGNVQYISKLMWIFLIEGILLMAQQ